MARFRDLRKFTDLPAPGQPWPTHTRKSKRERAEQLADNPCARPPFNPAGPNLQNVPIPRSAMAGAIIDAFSRNAGII